MKELTPYKKKQMKVAGSLGFVVGLFISLAFWAGTHKAASFVLIPAGLLIGLAQAYMAPEQE